VPLHAFIIGKELPKRRLNGITYHLVEPVPDFSHPLREIYFRRLELIDRLDVDYALVVDSYDVLCLQKLPSFETILGGSDVAASVEHMGARHLMGQGYTANFLNGGVFFWNLRGSRDIRQEIVERGRARFRTVADDQHCTNEVIQTKYYDRLRILPCQYNYRAYLKSLPKLKPLGWPKVSHLDGVVIYHNGPCIDEAKKLGPPRAKASLQPLPSDRVPLTKGKQFTRRLRQWSVPDTFNESLPFKIRERWPRSLFGHLLKLLRID